MYKAFIGKIKIKPHPNADRIMIGTICNEQVIVDKNTNDGELMIFFPTDGQLSEVFADSNNLIRYIDSNGIKKGGFFAVNRRIRVQKFRGEPSDGFACPLNYLIKTGVKQKTVDSLKEGDSFDELDNIPICNKYITPASRKKMNNRKNKKTSKIKKQNIIFPEHFDTKQFKRELQNIPINSFIYLTEKLHGTSGRYGNTYYDDKNFLYRIKRFFNKKTKIQKKCKYVVGSRRVLLNYLLKDYYDDPTFRINFIKDVWKKIKKGELIYGEIVGYTTNNKTIMNSQDMNKLTKGVFKKEDYKELFDKYGKTMIYKYGNIEKQCSFYVYRIVNINEDGESIELNWSHVKDRCKELGLNHVPEFNEGYPYFYLEDNKIINLKNNKINNLSKVVHSYLDGSSFLDNSHIREGVCIRIENGKYVNILKEKSFLFKYLEDIAKEDDNYVDIEEA